MNKETGGPAFPTLNEHQAGSTLWHYSGMTLRDYFAAKAMQGMLFHLEEGIKPQDCIVMAEDAYFLADAMLKAREQ